MDRHCGTVSWLFGGGCVTPTNNIKCHYIWEGRDAFVVVRVGTIYHQLVSHFTVTCHHCNNLFNWNYKGSLGIAVTFQCFL